MDGGMGALAAIELLNKTLELEPNGETKRESFNVDNMLNDEAHRKTHTKHFKITQTHTTEGELNERSDDEDAKHDVVVKHKTKYKSCFGSCFGKNK